MSEPTTEGSFRISGSIDVVTVGLLITATGYIATSYGGFGRARYLTVVGVLVAILGVVKVTYDHATGFDAASE